nr:MAG TPA: CCSMST1 family protein [Caudoviricetes sp.]
MYEKGVARQKMVDLWGNTMYFLIYFFFLRTLISIKNN